MTALTSVTAENEDIMALVRKHWVSLNEVAMAHAQDVNDKPVTLVTLVFPVVRGDGKTAIEACQEILHPFLAEYIIVQSDVSNN